jgi:hypothetical protein
VIEKEETNVERRRRRQGQGPHVPGKTRFGDYELIKVSRGLPIATLM